MKHIGFVFIALLLLSIPVHSATDPAKILDLWANGMGGKAKLAAVTTVYSRAAVATGGLNGTVEVWNTASGNQKEDLDFGDIFRSLTVFDAAIKKAWIRDQNGKVRELAGTEMQSTISSAYEGSFSHFFPSRFPGKILYKSETDQQYVLILQADGGQPVTVYLDKVTYLPVKEERPEAERISTLYFSDWREIDGIKMPFQIRQSTGDPKYDAVITINEIRFNVPVDQTMFARPEESAPDFRFASGTSATGIPFELNENHIYVQVRVNRSEPLSFLLDTGASFPVLNEKRAKDLGFELHGKVEGRGAGEGSTDVSFITDATFSLPGIEQIHQKAATITLDPIEAYEGHRMDGILGYDFISRFVVEIDYAAKVINVYDPAGYQYKGTGEMIPITLEDNTPLIHARVEQPNGNVLDGVFTLDTGSRSSLALSKPFHESHRLLDSVTPTIEAPWGFGVGGQTKQVIGRIGKFHIGKYTLDHMVTAFAQDTKGAHANPNIAGNIGGEILRRFKLILDYGNNRIILEPNKDFTEPFQFDMSGMTLFAKGPALKIIAIENVLAGSPAAATGLAKGDLIEEFEGRPVGEFSIEQIRQALKKDGASYKLKVRRGPESLTVTLALHPII